MNICIKLLITLFAFSLSAAEFEKIDRDSFYLQQVDYRKRLSLAVSLPGISRIRVRPSVESRYLVRKRIIKIERKLDQSKVFLRED